MKCTNECFHCVVLRYTWLIILVSSRSMAHSINTHTFWTSLQAFSAVAPSKVLSCKSSSGIIRLLANFVSCFKRSLYDVTVAAVSSNNRHFSMHFPTRSPTLGPSFLHPINLIMAHVCSVTHLCQFLHIEHHAVPLKTAMNLLET